MHLAFWSLPLFPDFKRPNGRIWGMLCIDLILKHENPGRAADWRNYSKMKDMAYAHYLTAMGVQELQTHQ